MKNMHKGKQGLAGEQGLAIAATSTFASRAITVAVDIDGVLYDVIEACRSWLHKTYNIPLHLMPEPDRYDMWAVWNLGIGKTMHEVLIEAVRAGHMFWTGSAYADGLEGLRLLKAAGYRVILISARDLPGIESLCREATEAWLASVGAVYDELHITSDKNSIAFDVLVDDYEKNVRSAHVVGRPALLLNRGWNINVELPQYHWHEVPAAVAALAA